MLDEGAGIEVDEEGGGGVLEDGPAYALPGEGPDTDFAGDPFDDLLLADAPLAAAIDMCEEELVPMPPADPAVDLADANFSVDVDGGCIKYYARVGDFYAICDRPNHGRGKCRKVRTRKAAAVRRGANAAQGLTNTNKQKQTTHDGQQHGEATVNQHANTMNSESTIVFFVISGV